MQRRGAVEQHRVVADDLRENLVHLWRLALDDLLRALHSFRNSLFHELVDDKGLEQLEGHEFWKAALMQLQLWTDDDNRTARIVHALAEKVLTEAPLLALQHIRKRLERTLTAAANRLRATPVVEQRVHRLLEHALLVPENDLRGTMHDQLLEPVIAIDDAPIQVIEIGRGEAAAVEWQDRKSTRLNSSHVESSYAVFCLKKKTKYGGALGAAFLFCAVGANIPAKSTAPGRLDFFKSKEPSFALFANTSATTNP